MEKNLQADLIDVLDVELKQCEAKIRYWKDRMEKVENAKRQIE